MQDPLSSAWTGRRKGRELRCKFKGKGGGQVERRLVQDCGLVDDEVAYGQWVRLLVAWSSSMRE